jgi:transcriptional regulator with XRE-family HTH domain
MLSAGGRMPETLAEWFTRHLKGCNLQLVAERLGVTRQTLYAYRKGTIEPDVRRLYRFCGVLALSDAEKYAAVDMLGET